jgi:hypothetical protein
VGDQIWLWVRRGGLVLYCCWAILLILQRPGLQYDEALLVLGGVHMRTGQGPLPLPHDPDTWLCFGERCIQLMSVRYVGAWKDYLSVPLFAWFGTHAEVVRGLSSALGLLGIWGVARLLAAGVSPRAGALAACAIAVNPAYVDLTVFDNGTVSIWMAALGVLSLAALHYLRHRSVPAAFLLGAAMGAGVWARANFVWMLFAVGVAAAIVWRKSMLPPVKHVAAMLAGGLAGGSVFLLYQVVSSGGTIQALSMFRISEPWSVQIPARLTMLGEALLSDREHRAMWNGPLMPAWQLWLFSVLVAAACVLCLSVRRSWGGVDPRRARFVALQIPVLAAILVFSRMPVAEHHAIIVMPLAAAACVLAGLIAAGHYRWGKHAALTAGAVYFGCAAMWQVAAVRGLAATGGVGQWSDAIFTLTDHLEQRYPNQEVKFLDWGFQNNFYVLTDGRLRSREIVGGPAAAGALRSGGVFVISGPDNRFFPASEAFLEALAAAGAPARRYAVRQRNRAIYAEIIEVPEGDWRESGNAGSSVVSRLSMGDPKSSNQLEGFHEIEEGGRRWTKQQFAITLAPPSKTGRVRFALDVYVPYASIEKLGIITITARLGNRVTGSMTFTRPGSYTFFVRNMGVTQLREQKNRIGFALDKALPQNSEYGRELGIVVTGARLEPE